MAEENAEQDSSQKLEHTQTPPPETAAVPQKTPDPQKTQLTQTSSTESDEEEGIEKRHNYEGYEPVCAADFPFEDDQEQIFEDQPVNTQLLRDKAKNSYSIIIFSAVFAISFIAILVWQILIAKCKVTNLCDTVDRSSLSSLYSFDHPTFRVPSALIWVGLTVGSFGLLLASLFAFLVSKRSVGTARMVEVATIIRKGSTLFLVHQNISILLPVAGLLVLIGLTINWHTAGAFSLGAVVCMATSHAGISIATRGNIRTSAASMKGLQPGILVAFRTGASAGLLILSATVTSLAAVYLMFSDVRSLAGFGAGASSVALFLRISAALFSRASGKSGSIVQNRANREKTDPRSAPGISAYIGSGIGTIFGLGPDLFDSFVIAVVGTAVLGSNLPFFYRDPYALCIFNHLHIDQKCGSFGYPEALSYAVYICRRGDLYMSYPRLATWSSSAAFVAIPFVIGAAGMGISFLCTAFLKTSKNEDGDIGKANVIMNIRKSIRLNMFLAGALLIGISAGICFGMFGSTSSFQTYAGFGNAKILPKMELNEDVDRCISRSVQDSASTNPVPVPKGGYDTTGLYEPIDANGYKIGSANGTATRMFLCCLLGVALCLLMTGMTTAFFTSSIFPPVHQVKKSSKMGMAQVLLRGFGFAYFSVAAPGVFLVVIAVSSFYIYGAYGVGLTAVTYASFLPMIGTTSVLASVCENARGIIRMSNKTRRSTQSAKLFSELGTSLRSFADEFSSGSMFISTVTLMFAVQQVSGLLPSTRALVGSPELSPDNLIGSIRHASFADILAIAAGFLGVAVPLCVTGLLLLSIQRVTTRMSYAIYESTKRPYAKFINAGIRFSLVESVVPTLLTLILPILLGFGLGKQALIVYGVSITVVSYLFSTFSKTLSSCLETAESLILQRNSEAHWNTLYSREIGVTLRECMWVLGAVSKSTVAVSLLIIELVSEPPKRQWLALIFLFLLMVVFCAVCYVKHRKHMEIFELHSDSTEKLLTASKKVSPFYERAHKVDSDGVIPGSAIDSVISTTGKKKNIFVDNLQVPDRVDTQFENMEHLKNTQLIVDGSGYVDKDEVRPGEE